MNSTRSFKLWKTLQPEVFKSSAQQYIDALRDNRVVLQGGMLDVIRSIYIAEEKLPVSIIRVRAGDVANTPDIYTTATYSEICSGGQSLGLKLLSLEALLAIMCLEPAYYQEDSGSVIAAAIPLSCRLSGYGNQVVTVTIEAHTPYFKTERARLYRRLAEADCTMSKNQNFLFAQ